MDDFRRCSLAVDVLGRMAASWNIPMITPVGTRSNLGNKNDFKTLTRLAYNMNKFSRFYLDVLSHFSWTDISVMYDKVHVFFQIVGESIHSAFVTAGLSSKLTVFDTNGQFDHSSMLIAAGQRSRVFAIACHGDTFRNIMVAFHKLGMATGDYVIIFVRLFDGDDVGIYTWDRSDNLNTVDHQFNDKITCIFSVIAVHKIARQAYESVFIVQPRRPVSTEFLQFEQEVKNRSLIDYDYSYGNQEIPIVAFKFKSIKFQKTIIQNGAGVMLMQFNLNVATRNVIYKCNKYKHPFKRVYSILKIKHPAPLSYIHTYLCTF
ncbi:hypothetical protein KUTeg_015635 [Tegillarca granosa]|uniref:Receptor ligand binding region domain-containing protein n=1 Tax=Tegillarca granosa TaxID=220873 RepID=A0ABQ9EQM6_TEGGR|nr:hypothetical protein KUTeg_015635 [Tegillarca granosa]